MPAKPRTPDAPAGQACANGFDTDLPPLPALADQTMLPVLVVQLDVSRGRLAWQIAGKGARWHRGCENLDQAVREAFKSGLVPPCVIDFIGERP